MFIEESFRHSNSSLRGIKRSSTCFGGFSMCDFTRLQPGLVFCFENSLYMRRTCSSIPCVSDKAGTY